MLTKEDVQTIVNAAKYRDWQFYLGDMGNGFYLQIRFYAPDSESGKVELQHCRKWYISQWMTETEVVDTIYKALEAAVLHEMKEEFRYNGHMIYNPHMSVNSRIKACKESEHRAAPTGTAHATVCAIDTCRRSPTTMKEILEEARKKYPGKNNPALKLRPQYTPLEGQLPLPFDPICDDCLCERKDEVRS